MTSIVPTKPLKNPSQFFAESVSINMCDDGIDVETDEALAGYEVESPFPLDDIEYDAEDIEEDGCYGLIFLSAKNLESLIAYAKEQGLCAKGFENDLKDISEKNRHANVSHPNTDDVSPNIFKR